MYIYLFILVHYTLFLYACIINIYIYTLHVINHTCIQISYICIHMDIYYTNVCIYLYIYTYNIYLYTYTTSTERLSDTRRHFTTCLRDQSLAKAFLALIWENLGSGFIRKNHLKAVEVPVNSEMSEIDEYSDSDSR